MSAAEQTQPILEYEYGSLHGCLRCAATNAVQVLRDVYGDYFSCLACGMVAYPEQFNARFVRAERED